MKKFLNIFPIPGKVGPNMLVVFWANICYCFMAVRPIMSVIQLSQPNFLHLLFPRSKTRETLKQRSRDPWKMGEEEASKHNGLIIGNTDTIRSFLRSASTDPHLSADLQLTASTLASQTTLPYKPLRALWFASPSQTRPKLSRLLYGSQFIFTSPKPREKVNQRMNTIPFLLQDRSSFSLFACWQNLSQMAIMIELH